jgi:hypothetical protein
MQTKGDAAPEVNRFKGGDTPLAPPSILARVLNECLIHRSYFVSGSYSPTPGEPLRIGHGECTCMSLQRMPGRRGGWEAGAQGVD